MPRNRIFNTSITPIRMAAVPAGFVVISKEALPAAISAAASAQQDLYRLAYEQAREAVGRARRWRRLLFRAAQRPAVN